MRSKDRGGLIFGWFLRFIRRGRGREELVLDIYRCKEELVFYYCGNFRGGWGCKFVK